MKTVKLSLAVMVAVAALASSGAVNVTASRDYVDRKITAVSNALDAAISSATPGSYSIVSNNAMNALSRDEATSGMTKWSWRSTGPVLAAIEWRNGRWVGVQDGQEASLVYFDPPYDADANATHLTSNDVTADRTRLPTMKDVEDKASTNDVSMIVTNRTTGVISGARVFPLARYDYFNDYTCDVGDIVEKDGRLYRCIVSDFGDGHYPWFPVDATYYFEDVTDQFSTNAIVRMYQLSTIDMSSKQDLLPYPTNAIPASVIYNPPWLTSFTESDPTIYEWAKAASKPTYSPVEVGAIPMSFGAAEMDPTSSYRYSTGDVMSISGKFYKAEWPFRPSTTPDPIGNEAVEELPDLKSFSEHILRNSFLPLGYGGTNMPHYKKIDIGYESGNQRRAYLLLDTDGIDIQTRWNGEVFRIRNGKIMYTTTDWSSYYEIDVTKILTRNSVLPFSYNTEAYKDSPTSSYYVYQYLTNNYLTALGTEDVYLKKSDASTTYLSKTDAASIYDTPDGVKSKISTALQNYRPEYTYGEYGTYRTRQDGVMQRKILTSYWNVSFTNLNNGLTMKPVSGWSNKWTCDLGDGSVTVNRANGVYTCEEYPIMTATEDYDGDCVIWFSGPLGMMVADSGTFDWEDYDNLAKQSGVGGSVSNIVTQSYVREKLGVYLYIGEDGGVYVHTPTNQEEEQ